MHKKAAFKVENSAGLVLIKVYPCFRPLQVFLAKYSIEHQGQML